MEEARERLKLLQSPDHKPGALEELQAQIGKLSVALAEARAREGEHLAQLQSLSKDRQEAKGEVSRLLALLTSAQALLIKPVAGASSSPKTRAPTAAYRKDASKQSKARRAAKKVPKKKTARARRRAK